MPSIHVSIIVLLVMSLFQKLWTATPIMNYLGVVLILGSLVMGHLSSAPTAQAPLPSSLFYNYDVSTGQAKWATEDKNINIGNASYLQDASRSQMNVPFTRSYWNTDTDVPLHINIPQILIDSTNKNVVRIIADDGVFNTRLLINSPSNLKSLYINEQMIFSNRVTDDDMVIEAFAMRTDTMTLRVERIDEDKMQVIGINSNFNTLPIIDELPTNALRGDAYTGIVQEIKM